MQKNLGCNERDQARGLTSIAANVLADENHRHYEIIGLDVTQNPAYAGEDHLNDITRLLLCLQPSRLRPGEVYHGVTVEALLAICSDRLRGIVSGPASNAHYAAALEKINAALNILVSRPQYRSVEKKVSRRGTSSPH